jgi:hypothetical protein
MSRLHESHAARTREDQQACFADLISDDDLIALLEWKETHA